MSHQPSLAHCLLLTTAAGLATLAACSPPQAPADTLPFFPTPDWTARWMQPSDPGYDKIPQIPAFTLTDQEGHPLTEKNLDGKITVANFFFSRCRNICPRMSANMRLLQDTYKEDDRILLLSHSVDPESDSVPTLHTYAITQGADPSRWRLVTGDRQQIYALARNAYFAGNTPGPSVSGRDFLHTEDFILLDARRHIRGLYNGTLRSEMDRIREDIVILQKESQDH